MSEVQKMRILCNFALNKKILLMLRRTTPTIVARDSRSVTVRMSNSRWRRYQQLEESYVVASHVLNGLAEMKSLEPMTIEEAEAELDRL